MYLITYLAIDSIFSCIGSSIVQLEAPAKVLPAMCDASGISHRLYVTCDTHTCVYVLHYTARQGTGAAKSPCECGVPRLYMKQGFK